MIALENITKEYPGFKLDRISFEIKEHEIFALIGPNGAGKTTIVRIILGVIESYKGKIIKEKNINIGFVLENERPFENLYPLEYLKFFAQINGNRTGLSHVIDLLNLKKCINKKNGVLSKGTQKKLCIAKAIISEPDLIILDEPFEGVEPETRREIKDFLIEYSSRGKSVFITSHELYEIENFCTHVGIIYEGKFLGKREIEEIKSENLSLEKFYLGIIKKIKT